ncbi:outer membrane beta-barrel family protein [Carboxylicivirga sp. M1479]|uniref:TonB-dependent receptor n=1 Tax=Carboxylicivirga sp. M1479 TaxID=2594476 RepID=UPI0011784234|nr:outer membrane beta-barrel family protein [Carboxylicivirga sp. M1479]TRX70586.1 TonB-dependent receptor [Carboxylicivirga sp. M1479]
MNYKQMIAIVGFIFLSLATYAQTGIIKGKVVDANSNEEIPFANIALMQNGSIITGSVTKDDGSFKLTELKQGNYDIAISFLGYESRELKNITISNDERLVNLKAIQLSVSDVKIEGVEVKAMAQTVRTKIDRKTYRAQDFATASGGTAVDILDKLPAVSVDGEGTVSVRGTSDFLVYINGKPTQTNASDMLSQIPAEQIKDVEIITVPGARYDAQGKGGIINITTQKGAADGLSVVANGMIGGTPWTNKDDVYSHQKLDNNRYNASVNLMYNKDKLSLSGALSMQSRNNKGRGIIDPYIYQDPEESVSGFPGSYYVLDGEGSRPKWYTNMMANMGVNYQLSENAELAANYQYSKRTSGRTANYVYDAYFADAPDGDPYAGTLQEIYNPNDIHRDGWFSNLSVDYTQKIGDDSKLRTSFIYETSNLDQTIDNKEFPYDGERYYYDDTPDFHSFQSDETPIEAYRFEIDYQHTYDNGNSLNVGAQPQWVRLDGSFAYDTIIGNGYWGDPSIESYDNSIDLKRDIYSAYIDYNGKSGKLSYILGLRAEYMDQLMTVSSTEYFEYVYGYFSDVGDGRDFDQTDFEHRKFDLFPTLHAQYDLNKVNSLSLAASRRINRPPAKDMAPYLYRRHQEIYEMGDPLLEPEYILNAELNYTRKFGKNNMTLTGFYRGVDNAIYRVNRVAYDMGNPGGVLLRSYTNAGNQTSVGAELGVNVDLLSKVKLFVGGSLYDFNVIADDELLGESRDSRSTNWNIKTNASWMMTDPLKLTVDYSIKSGSVTPQGESLQFQALNAAINYKPQRLSGWTFSAKVLDILGTNQAGGYTAAYEGDQVLLRRDYVYDYEGQIVEIGISYSFNSKKQKAQKKHIGDDYF